MTTLFGIPNCDTMKKARAWLSAQGIEYNFHNYKKDGVDGDELRQWVEQVGWEVLLNRRGMMWRKLDDATRDNIDQASAMTLMQEIPSIIKRPVLKLDNGQLHVGFKETDYEQIFSGNGS